MSESYLNRERVPSMKSRGFTLIELIIAVAVVAILARIAYPSYASFMARGKVTDALASLGDYRVKMEQYFQDNRNFGTAGAACPVAAPASQYFTYTCAVGTPNTTYTATATSIAGAVGAAAGDYTYSINESNTKSTSRFKGSAVTKACWLIRGSEC
jgi:type IV pilus assembly protein PilE